MAGHMGYSPDIVDALRRQIQHDNGDLPNRRLKQPYAGELCRDTEDKGLSDDSHYRQGGIEPKDFIISNDLVGWKAIAIEYIFRAGHKDSESGDIRKAMDWLNFRLEFLEKNGETFTKPNQPGES